MSMRESTFSSFLVDDGNRVAHDVCLAISRAEPVSPLPLVLLGERGSGKTHLLRAVAQRLRASLGHAVIVLISPQSKPEELARLTADPRAIDMARYAVLLIDDFHAFSGDFDRLAGLMRVFLENDHPVVVATEAHPDRLAAFPPALLRLVRAGRCIQLGGGAEAAIRVVESNIRSEQREAIMRLEKRIHELESGAEPGRETGAGTAEAIDAALRDLEEARAEIEHLRGENALLSVSAREATVLRRKLDQLERERVERASRPPEDTSTHSDELKRNLDEARYDAQKAREEARGMLERAQGLLAELHKSRESYAVAQRDRERQREDLRRFQVLPGEPPEDGAAAEEIADPVVAAEPVQAAPNRDLDALRDEVHRLQESLVRARAERDNFKSHLAHIRQELDTASGDLERMRSESAEEAAQHAARVEELELALVTRQSEIDELQGLQRAFTEEVRSLQSQVTEGADVLQRLMELFGNDSAVQSACTGGAGEQEPSDPASEHVVRPDFGEGIRLVPRRGPALHHVEEIRGQTSSFFPSSLPPLEDDAPGLEGRARSA
jgi:hypothetical protein